MEEYKKDDRGRSKAKRLTQADPHTKVDSSTWTPPEALEAGVKTGARPLVKRLYKKGGKVVGKHEGKDSVKHAGRMPRKAGGRTNKLTPDNLINRDVRTANEVREGEKHEGAFKKGGRAHKFGGGMMGDNPVSQQNQMMGKAAGMMKKGGKVRHREYGGTDPIGAMIKDNDFPPSKPSQTLNAVSPKTEMAPSKEPKMQPRELPKAGMHGAKKGGKIKHPDEKADRQLIKSMIKPTAFKAKGGSAHGKDCTCKMCGGGRTMKYSGGGIFSGDSKKKVPGDVGGRQARASGGSIRDQFNAEFAKQRAAGAKTFDWTNPSTGKTITYTTDLGKATPSGGSRNVGMGKANRDAQAMRSEGTSNYAQEPANAASMAADRRRSTMAADPEMQSIVNRSSGDFNVGPTRANEPAAEMANIIRRPTARTDTFAPNQTDYPIGAAANQDQFLRDDSNPLPGYPGSRKAGGRTHHAKGGRTKGKTNINIIIGGGHGHQQPPMGMGQMPNAPVSPRIPQQQPAMPPMPPQGGMPPMPPQGMPPMARKSGGRTGYPIDTGAGGANARLEKIDAYGLKPSKRK